VIGPIYFVVVLFVGCWFAFHTKPGDALTITNLNL